MLINKISQIIKVMISKATGKRNNITIRYADVFIHPTIFNATFSAPKNAKHQQRVPAAKSDPAAHEDMFSLEVNSSYRIRQPWNSQRNFGGEITLYYFICIKTHHPASRDWRIVQRPLELFSLVDECMTDHYRSKLASYLYSTISRHRIDHEHLGRERDNRSYGSGNVHFLIVSKNDDRHICHVSAPASEAFDTL